MLLDTYAWIELFNGTIKGFKVKEIIAGNQCFTSAISIAELSEWIEKNKLNREHIFHVVKNLSTIIEVNQEQLETAGVLKIEKRKAFKDFGLIDAIILATAKQYGLPILTGDKHFEGENVIML
ncbi:MAG: PIN domain-containing protein [Candidatus Diapherotrites archaeon]|nr:PIN domain-containing protein [Candidatus Diapherotrites archaeon]